jgi:hypothetical protein
MKAERSFFQNEIGRFRVTFDSTTAADDELVEKLLTPGVSGLGGNTRPENISGLGNKMSCSFSQLRRVNRFGYLW